MQIGVRRTEPTNSVPMRAVNDKSSTWPLPSRMRNAVRYTIDWLTKEKGLSREDAYLLCSAVGDLKISEIVDQPNWIASFYMPLGVFVR